jgi:hypothetical protein
MYRQDSRGRTISPGARVRWSDPPHLGGATQHGTVVESIRGGWFRVREDQPGSARGGQRRDGDPLVKPTALTIIPTRRCQYCFAVESNPMRHNDWCRTILYGVAAEWQDA